MARLVGSMLAVDSTTVETRAGAFRLQRGFDLARRRPALAITHGAIDGDAPLLARVHSACITSELLGSCDCDCSAQLEAALHRIAEHGRGAVFYLLQEGRGAGFVAKARDRMMVQASGHRLTTFEAYARLGLPHDLRDYREVVDLRGLLGATAPLVLLTNNPDKVERLERVKIPIASTEPLRERPSPWNQHYLASKGRSGHALLAADAPTPDALPPFVVEEIEPTPLPGTELIRAASYALAVRVDGRNEPAWLRCNVFADRRHGAVRLRLSAGGDAGARRALEHSVVDRLPLRDSGPRRRAIDQALSELAHAGGRLLLHASEDPPPCDAELRAILDAPLP